MTTVTQDLLKTIIHNYPIVPSWLVHCAGRTACLSGGQRLRELKSKGIAYTYHHHKYDFSCTPLLIIYSLLKESEK